MNRELIRQLLTGSWFLNFAHTMVRVTLGSLLVYHGWNKVMTGLGGMIKKLTELGWPYPELQAFSAAYIELAGGILITIGLLTRPAAVMSTLLFLIIVFVFHGADPFQKKEMGLLFLSLSIYISLLGPGRWSLDARVFGPRFDKGA